MSDDPIKDGIRAHIRKNHGKLIPFSSEALWGCPVRVVRPLLVEAWMGGWGDGWYESNPGALYLLGSAPYPRNPLCIQFWCGPEPLAVYRPEHGRSGGLVLLSDLGCFEDLTPIISRIEAAFPDQAEAWRWIQAPCEALGGETPRRLLGTAEGHKQIEIGLARI